jgi:hypothetical protein
MEDFALSKKEWKGSDMELNAFDPINITVNYQWIISEVKLRLGYLPNDIEKCLLDLEKEQRKTIMKTDHPGTNNGN